MLCSALMLTCQPRLRALQDIYKNFTVSESDTRDCSERAKVFLEQDGGIFNISPADEAK